MANFKIFSCDVKNQVSFHCVGREKAISDIEMYVDCHLDKGFKYDVFLERLIKQEVYTCVLPLEEKGLVAKLLSKCLAYKINKKLKNHGMYIDFDGGFLVGALEINPIPLMKALQLTEDDVKEILSKGQTWSQFFEEKDNN